MFIELNQTRPRIRDSRVIRPSPLGPCSGRYTKSVGSSWSSIPYALPFSILIFLTICLSVKFS